MAEIRKTSGGGSADIQPQFVQYMYYNAQGEQIGPAMGAEMKYLYDKAVINRESFIWTTGMTEWKQLKDVPLYSYVLGESAKSAEKSKESKAEGDDSEDLKKKKKKKRKKKSSKTWIYVTGLPQDVTEDELKQHFSKCGFIQEDAIEGKPMIKIYRDQEGRIKGDCSICYLQEPSVELALSILDQAPLRLEDARGSILTLQRAHFTQSDQMDSEQVAQKEKRKQGGEWEKKVKLRKLKQKQALSWNEEGLEDGFGLKIVVLKNLFDPKNLEDPGFVKELEEDLVGECAKCGNVIKLTVIDKNPQGIAIVKFESSRSAEKCIELMNGRWFDKRELEAFFWDGETDYRVKSSEEDENKRIESFGDWLEAQGGDQSSEEEFEEGN